MIVAAFVHSFRRAFLHFTLHPRLPYSYMHNIDAIKMYDCTYINVILIKLFLCNICEACQGHPFGVYLAH